MFSLCHTSTTLTFPQAPGHLLMLASVQLCAFVGLGAGNAFVVCNISAHVWEHTYREVPEQNSWVLGSRSYNVGSVMWLNGLSSHRFQKLWMVQNTVFIQNIAQIFTYTSDKTGLILSPSTQSLISTQCDSWPSAALENGAGLQIWCMWGRERRCGYEGKDKWPRPSSEGLSFMPVMWPSASQQ